MSRDAVVVVVGKVDPEVCVVVVIVAVVLVVVCAVVFGTGVAVLPDFSSFPLHHPFRQNGRNGGGIAFYGV